MAHGEQIGSGRSPGPGYWTNTYLLHEAISAGEGPPVDVRGYRHLTVDVVGLRDAGTSVLIEGRNRVDAPWHALGVDLIDDGISDLPCPVSWVRASISRDAPKPKSPVTVVLYAVV
jgi:hypothetical protein